MNVFLFTVLLTIVACSFVGEYQIYGRTYSPYLLGKEISTLKIGALCSSEKAVLVY